MILLTIEQLRDMSETALTKADQSLRGGVISHAPFILAAAAVAREARCQMERAMLAQETEKAAVPRFE